ncbi:MAG: hypothetical protein MPW15_22450 [Candidatus Manganitrophus sp.]|nr:hypothetical protein [Candidatus Manganitrophus sp.]
MDERLEVLSVGPSGRLLCTVRPFRNWPLFSVGPLALPKVEREMSRFLGTRFKVVETTIGSAALDIDDEASYRTLSARFREWHEFVSRFNQGQEGRPCPLRTEACG